MNLGADLPKLQPQRLAIKLTATGERTVRSGHPWLFSKSIIKINKEGGAGDLAIIFGTKSNEVIGIGLYDPDSPIRIKILYNNGPVTIDANYFTEKIARAYAIRIPLLETDTNSYRLIFGENDGFPGFIADIYADVLVVKLYSEIWFPYLADILEVMLDTSGAQCAVLRLSRKLQSKENHGLTDGMVLYGTLEEENVQFTEHGVNFAANVIHGHKTGYFLDHRHNRKRVGEISKGKTVLDVFSYAGGFSIHALVNSAKEVTSVDISKQALEVAKFNASLNSFDGVHHTISADAFELMNQLISEGKTYDVVVIDPPSFAKSANEIKRAEKKYSELAKLGASLTAKGGMLVLASCSSRISSEEFFGINEKSLNDIGKSYILIERTAHDLDHPISFPEGAYLKTGYYQFQ
jgi:23S rRNA (cytosine1962-C5)-methyltransferase